MLVRKKNIKKNTTGLRGILEQTTIPTGVFGGARKLQAILFALKVHLALMYEITPLCIVIYFASNK